jgi:transposase-like protein
MKRKKSPNLEELIPDPELRKRITDELYGDQNFIGKGGVFSEMLQGVLNAALEGELDAHLDQESSQGIPNRRNGKGRKQVRTSSGMVELSPPRDRNGSFEPQLVQKRQRELNGKLDQTILSLYAKGNSQQDVQQLMQELYGLTYSTSTISSIIDKVRPVLLEWQQRPLQGAYLMLYLDGIHYRVKQDGQFISKCVYSVYAVDVEGYRDVLGLYLSDAESASQWGQIMEDLQFRGLKDVFFVSIDGLSGFSEAIAQVFPSAIVQRCIVHKVRNSVRFIPDKNKKALCRDLRAVYRAPNRQQAALALEEFEGKWGRQGQKIAASWRADWEELMAFMDFSSSIRRMIYTTNPVEALHRILRKVTKTKGAWVNESALLKQLYLALMDSKRSWGKRAYQHLELQAELEEKFGNRYTQWLSS